MGGEGAGGRLVPAAAALAAPPQGSVQSRGHHTRPTSLPSLLLALLHHSAPLPGIGLAWTSKLRVRVSSHGL